jgi:hypothetical protein
MNRRSFIQKTGLLGTILFVSLKADAFSLFDTDRIINGRIASKGNGLFGVVVSDGFNVVQTDKDGNFNIKVNEKAKFLWISTPAGYEFTTDSFVVKQYEQLNTKSTLNFELKALKKDDNHHQFIIWADPQVKNKKDVAQMMQTSVPDVQKVIREMGPDALVHGICVGDLVWDNLPLYDDYNIAVSKMGIPFFQALGNHDMDYRQGGDETSDKTFKQYFGPTYYSFNRGKAHYVVLDDVRYLGIERTYDGYITEEQLAWMEKDLAFVPKDNLLIINLHIPVHNSVKNRADFYKILEKFTNVHVMSGHTHYNKNVIQNGVYEHNHGTVCGAWWTGPICEDGTPRGYGVYEVKGTQLKWYYKSTGLDRKHQLSMDVETLTNQKRIIANVWNYDPEWKVECFLDGKSVGQMEKQIGFDPEAVRLYLGDQLPVARSFAEPRKTDHIFMVHCDPNVKKIRVVATDRFGEQFSAEV